MSVCELCTTEGGVPVVRHAEFRVIRAPDVSFPAFYRVVWNAHVAEWTDLAPPQRSLCMQAVAKVETVLRDLFHRLEAVHGVDDPDTGLL